MKKKLYVIAISIALIMSLLVVNVNAADPKFSTSMKASSTNVEKDKEFTITVKVSNLNVGNKGINRLTGYLTFDDKVFEDISEDSIEGLNDCKVTYSADKGKLEITNAKYINKDSEICEITFKTKSNTTASKGTIELKDIVASDSESEFPSDPVSLEIGIGSKSGSNNNSSNNTNTIRISGGNNTNRNNTTNNTNRNTENEDSGSTQIIANTNRNANTNANNTNIANTNRNNNVNTNNSNTNIDANQTNEEEMPDTGIDDTIVKAILLVGLVGVLGYIKLKSLDKK